MSHEICLNTAKYGSTVKSAPQFQEILLVLESTTVNGSIIWVIKLLPICPAARAMKRLIPVLNMLLWNVPSTISSKSRQLLKHMDVLLKHTGLLKCYFKAQMMTEEILLYLKILFTKLLSLLAILTK